MKKLFLVLALCIVSLCGCKTVPVRTYGYDMPTVAGQSHATKEQVRKAIVEACLDKKWSAVDLGPNIIEASTLIRHKHNVVVNIEYSELGYKIRHAHSENMKHKQRDDGTEVIHKSYAKWVENLNYQIKRRLTQINANLPPTGGSVTHFPQASGNKKGGTSQRFSHTSGNGAENDWNKEVPPNMTIGK